MPKKEDKNFVWKSLRISFWTMVGLWVISMFLGFVSSSVNWFWISLSLIWLVSVIYTFVLSIIHLNKYKEKGFAITSLVISSLFIILNIVSFFVGLLSGASG